MKENYINLTFVIDESGSMFGLESDVVGGFKKIIDEQKAIKEGSCTISLFKFNDKVTEVYLGKDVNEVDYLEDKSYSPGGMTAMNDGIGTAIKKVGEWLKGMKEEDRPEKNLVVIMTDGFENSSREYTLEQVKEMIKHQEEKYSWTFTYLGTDITDASTAESLGIKSRAFSSRTAYASNYAAINSVVSAYRCATGDSLAKSAVLNTTLDANLSDLTETYEKEIGQKITNNSK